LTLQEQQLYRTKEHLHPQLGLASKLAPIWDSHPNFYTESAELTFQVQGSLYTPKPRHYSHLTLSRDRERPKTYEYL